METLRASLPIVLMCGALLAIPMTIREYIRWLRSDQGKRLLAWRNLGFPFVVIVLAASAFSQYDALHRQRPWRLKPTEKTALLDELEAEQGTVIEIEYNEGTSQSRTLENDLARTLTAAGWTVLQTPLTQVPLPSGLSISYLPGTESGTRLDRLLTDLRFHLSHHRPLPQRAAIYLRVGDKPEE